MKKTMVRGAGAEVDDDDGNGQGVADDALEEDDDR